MTTVDDKVLGLETENKKLITENQRLKDISEGKKVGMSDDAIDGVVATVIILSIVTGLVFWLNSLPSS